MTSNMSQSEVDIHMEDVDEGELLGSEATDDALDESMKDIKLENTEGDSQYGTENRKEGQGTGTAGDDGEADSDAEFAAEDDRKGQSGDMKWQWHIELYPIAYEDMQLENFTKMHKTASHCQMMFTEQASGPAKGEAHFYTDKLVAAKTIIRNLCCKKFQHQRPFVYISKRRNQSSSEFETAVLRLDLAEAAKMRWDKQRKTTGESPSHVAKITNVPLGTSVDLLNVVFARAYKIQRETVKCERDTSETKDSEMEEENNSSGDKHTGNFDSAEGKVVGREELDADDNAGNAAEEMISNFNGNLTIEGVSRTSLKGLLLGYRRVTIGNQLLDIKPLSTEEIDVQALRKEARERRKEESQQASAAAQTSSHKATFQADDRSVKAAKGQSSEGGVEKGGITNREERWGPSSGADRGRNIAGGRGGASAVRGGRGGNQHVGTGQGGGWGRGGMMKTGRQKMNEKSMRRGGGAMGGPPRGPAGNSFSRGQGDSNFNHDIRLLQSQLQMNTIQLQRQIDSLSMVNRGGYHDFQDYPPGPPRPRSMLSEWDEDWSWSQAPPARGRFSGARGVPRGGRH
ncbi:hypothetical protein BaRGS_00007787 [Batillaria attramentaria]|uniref:Uncharacterized protein n=1 Tax=Batillaria attramentaria TaxID=370345 RepID=A0ABD0LPB6_9CAEN